MSSRELSAQPPQPDCAPGRPARRAVTLKLSGICPPARGLALAELIRQHTQIPLWLVLAPEPKLAAPLAEDIAFFYNELLAKETNAGAKKAAAGSKKTAGEATEPPRGQNGKTTRSAAAASAQAKDSIAAPSATALRVALLPEAMPDSRDMREAFAASSERLAILGQLRALRERSQAGAAGQAAGNSSPPTATLVIVTTPAALLQPVPALEALAEQEITLALGQERPFAVLLEQLRELDYDCEALCEAPGHYAVRGGIIDLYPVTATQPYRIDFFGDEIESIRELDPVTQRSGASVHSVTLSATPRIKLDPARSGLADYLLPNSGLILVEPVELEDELRSAAAATSSDQPTAARAADSSPRAALAALRDKAALQISLSEIEQASELLADDDAATGERDASAAAAIAEKPAARHLEWQSEPLALHRALPSEALLAHERLQAEVETRSRFLQQLLAWQREGYSLHFVASQSGEAQRMAEILDEEELRPKLRAHFHIGSLNEGFRFSMPTARAAAEATSAPSEPRPTTPRAGRASASSGLIVVTETELFGRQRTRRAQQATRQIAQRSQIDQLLDFAELAEGDYVVHLQHGIAQFRGLATLDTAQGPREVISLEFDEQVTLHVPLQEPHLISRYVGLTKVRPQLGKIGSGRWEKTRKAAERATIDLAAELLRIQAAREAQPGFAFPEDTNWQREFEASFPYNETRDQLRAIEEAKADMEQRRPMNRLICGDVGFGKTEVAIRAAFKAVQGGRQVALLVPTTVLAQQHLNTFRERMAGYPIVVEMLSRFRSHKDQQAILAATAAGQVDILIGTHRLLQGDVVFRELGLLIVDEEQRFGVKHKERFKAMRASLDVLSMSATPIPRTLYMALTGARDLSVIETPPANRHPIHTIVKTYDEALVAEAIRHELRRGGQVFYLHNRVQTIDLVAARLRELVPGLSVGVGHGKMEATGLERVMTDFVAGKYQVLVCTTIIESGLDIPNCNTIIIESADRFGLSQLYQLRGRVGRFKHQAYAYLLLHRHTRLLDIARQRLGAMRQHNQLGAGFRIAMRDLELRGAGNLLGSQQSGHIVGVGFELYCQLLRQSVARLKGEKTAAAIRASVKLDFVRVGDGEASASSGAAPAPRRGRHQDGYTALKEVEAAAALVPIHACLPASYIAETRLRIDFYRRLALAQSPAQLKEIAAELRDRFGKFGEPVKALLALTELRICAEQKGLALVEAEAARLKCLRASGRPDDWVQLGARFPRLTAPSPLLRLREILTFLKNLPDPSNS